MPNSAQHDDPMVGRTVANRYVIQSRIGSGGMGTVYRAVQSGLGRSVALKLLKDEVSWDPDTITRFHREAKAMSLLVHANTVRVFDFGQTTDGTLYLAMEFLEGDLLTRRIEREGGMSPPEAIKVAIQILSSLHEAHSKGIIHRDLKPDNILLTTVDGHTDEVVKVLDFGIAKVFEGDNQFDQLETQVGTVFGTPRYMSPEQAQGKPLDARSDIYSVGVLLYQMLTGLAPFRDEDAVVVMAKHIRDKPEPPVKVAPERRIPGSLNRAVLKALEKSADKRFQDAGAFIQALQRCLNEAEELQRASRTGVFVRGTAARERWPWIAAFLVLGTAVAFGGYTLARSDDWGDPATQASQDPTTGEPSELIPIDDIEVEPERLIPTVVESEPPGAEVYLDGERVGTTPYTHELAPGTFVELTLRHGREEATITLTPTEEPQMVWLQPLDEGRPSSRMRARPRPTMRATTMSSTDATKARRPARMVDEPYTMFL